jgi:hypothetical protein
VPHEEKDTELNTVKERQICGPTNEKKCMANAFINELERIASEHHTSYCGRDNWIQICDKIKKSEQTIKNIIYGAADGSGFDMSQLKEHNELMNELIILSANHKNVIFTENQNIDDLIFALESSLLLKVDGDNGNFTYEAIGRASGDGWTTFGNTMLMAAYYEYTFHIAGIKEYFLKAKGDDTIFGFNPKYMCNFKEAHSKLFTQGKHQHSHGLAQICTDIKFGDLTELDFLSSEFIRCDNGYYRMVRILPRVIQSISWTTCLDLKNMRLTASQALEKRRELAFNNGLSLLAWGSGLPIIEVLGKKLVELGTQGKTTDWNKYADEARIWHKDTNDRDAYLCHLGERYNLSSEGVGMIEKAIASIGSLNGIVDIPELDLLYKC